MPDPATPATPITFPRVIDATMRSSWLLCPHHFFRRHCQGLTHDVPSIHLHFGACIASGLEEARRQYCRGVSASEAVLLGAEYLVAQWGSFQYTPNTRTEANKTLANCLLALTDYFHEWPLDTDPTRIHYHNGEPCIEFSGVRTIPGARHPETGEPILYCGRFDLIGDYRGKPWGVDDKTTSRLSTNGGQQWTLRSQFTGYCWLAEGYDVPLDGFLIREIQILTDSTRPAQLITARPRWMIDRWLAVLQHDVTRMIECWHQYRQGHALAFPPILDNGCYSYGRPCEFMDLCATSTPELWENSYTFKLWNPLTRGTED